MPDWGVDFEKMYKSFGLSVQELPKNYSPDRYARDLMKNVRKSSGVSYTYGIANGRSTNAGITSFVDYSKS